MAKLKNILNLRINLEKFLYSKMRIKQIEVLSEECFSVHCSYNDLLKIV